MNKATLEINGKKITLELTDEQIKQLTGANEGRFKPGDGDDYYYVDYDFGSVMDDQWANSNVEQFRYSQRNVFKTEEEAEKELERQESLAILRDDAQDWAPDWEDREQLKFNVYYAHDANVFHVWSNSAVQYHGAIYFETKELAQQSIKDHEEDWLRVFGVNV